MTESKSAKLQRAYRNRMKEQGLVPKQVYIRPEHSPMLARTERALRQINPEILVIHSHERTPRTMPTSKPTSTQLWTTTDLCAALQNSILVSSQQASVELIDGVSPAINVVMHEYGDLPILISVSGEQMFCSTTLWNADSVKNASMLNEELLLMNPINPLSNFGLMQMPDGKKTYVLFGELSAASDLHCVIEEIDTLAINTLEAAEIFSDQLIS